jgi:DNA polymerase-1
MSAYSSSPHANRVRLGKLLEKYNGRILGGIRMSIDKSSGHPNRYKYLFIKLTDEPAIIVKDPRYRPPGWQEILREKQPPGWEKTLEEDEKTRHRGAGSPPPPPQETSPNENMRRGVEFPKPPENEEPETKISNMEQYVAPEQLRQVFTLLDNGSVDEEKVDSGPAPPGNLNNSTPRRTDPAPLFASGCMSVGSALSTCEALNYPLGYSKKSARRGGDLLKPPEASVQNQPFLHPDIHPPFLALDLETYGLWGAKAAATRGALDPWKGEIRLLTIADAEGSLQQFDLMSAPVLPPEIISAIGWRPLIIHKGSFDLLFLAHKLGVHPTSVFCTLTASWLLAPSYTISHELGAVLERYLGIKIVKGLGSSDWGSFVLTEDQIEYAYNDVRYLHQLKGVLETELGRVGLDRVFELESTLLPVVVGLEKHGFAVDVKKMRGLLAQAEARQNGLQEALRIAFKIPALNPGSTPQVVKAFRSIGITVPNANEETLLPLDHECASMVVEQHKAKKRVGTIEGLLRQVQVDGRIHAQFKPLGTITGRFSSSKPNLQNIDRGELRTCFIPSSQDRRLIVADYSQIELRIGAIFAKDAAMLDAFRAGEDLHRKTAAEVLSKPIEEVVNADRQLAKAINFGFLYGQQAKGFQVYAKTNYGIAVGLKDAINFRSKFFAQRQGLRRWHKVAWSKVAKITEARTILGRVVLPRNNTDWEKFQLLTNYITQGSAADVLKVAMVKLRYRLPDLIIVATVHDELVFDVPAEGAEALCELIRLTMIDAFSEVFGDIVPMEVEAKVCSNWGEKD